MYLSAGQPTKYSKKIVSQCWKYLNIARPSKDEHGQLDEVIPSIEGLAFYINVRRSTIYNWLKDDNKPEFLDIVERIMEKQSKTLISGALSKVFDSKIAALLMTKHGYKDKIDVTTDDRPIEAPIMNIINKVYGGTGDTSSNS